MHFILLHIIIVTILGGEHKYEAANHVIFSKLLPYNPSSV
jgi:hypothetical protein